VGSYVAQTPTGLHNMLGNVWEWVEFSEKRKGKGKGRSARTESNQRALRGGSFIDSYVTTLYYIALAHTALLISSPCIITYSSCQLCRLDGSFNHAVYVSTKQLNSADSAASNIGFRCASSIDETSIRLSEGSNTDSQAEL
jgi:formylglycine-generating enzyme required for sulfatase activity